MNEARTGFDEDRLPWLEAVDDEDAPPAISAGKMLAGVVVVLLALGMVAGVSFWVGREDGPVGGEPELIAAPEGPYKVEPENPGGLDVAGDSETAFATSAGEDTDAALDTTKLKEPPRIAVRPEPKPAPPPPVTRTLPPNETKEPVASPPPAAAPAGPTIQLGAYSSRAKAETGWVLLSSRFGAVAALTKRIEQATVNGKTVYRLRAVAPDRGAAQAACDTVKAGGESCVVVN